MKHSKVFQPAKIEQCMGKNSYNSLEEAEVVKEEQELRDIKSELELKIYRCPMCSKFHLSQVKNNDVIQ